MGLPTSPYLSKGLQIASCLRLRWCLFLLTKEVGAPVNYIEEGEDEREGDPRDDINPFAPAGELGKPGSTAASRWLRVHVDLTLPRLVQGETVPMGPHQWLLLTPAPVLTNLTTT